MTVRAAGLSESLMKRVCERAASTQSTGGVPLIVLEEMQNCESRIEDGSRLEIAKRLLIAAYRTAESQIAAPASDGFYFTGA